MDGAPSWEGPLALALGQDALSQGLLESAQCLALLAVCQGPYPTAEALSLVGAACMAAGEARRALHFMGHAQQAAQLSWGPCSAAGGAAGATQAAAVAVGPSAGPAAGSAPTLPGGAALLSSIANCHERLGEWSEALAALERIPPPLRCAGTWARLGCLHARSAAGRLPAIEAYKACLRLCPNAIEAALALAELRVPADEICSLLAGMLLPAALERVLQHSPQLQSMVAAQLALFPAEAGGEAAAAWPSSGAPRADCNGASLDEELEHRLSAGALAAGPGGLCTTDFSEAGARPESPRALPAALLQRPACSVAAAAVEQDSWQTPISARLKGLLLSQSVEEACRASHVAAPVAGTGGAVSAGAEDEAEEDGASGVHTPPASSPVAAARPSPFTPSSGQGTPALASPACQHRAAPCRPSSPCGSPHSARADGSLAVQQEAQQPQQPQLQQLAARRTLHPRLRPEHEAPAQQPALASCAPAAERHAAGLPAQAADQCDEGQEQRHHPCVPQALLAAAQHALGCLGLMVRLAAALAAEDKGAALPLALQLLDAAPRHSLALALAAQCQADHGSTASALCLYEQARQGDPYSLAGAARHADLLRQAGDSVALASLACQLSADASMAGAGGRAEPWIVAAHARELTGDLYEAVGLLRRAVERDPGCAEAHLQMGRLVHRACAASRAAGTAGAPGLADFEEALRLRPSARAFREAVEAALGADEPQAARRLARRALEAFPSSVACRLLQAQVLAREARRAGRAEAQLRQVLREEPRCEEAALLLAVLLVQGGRRREAQALLADQLAAAPSLAVHVIAGRMALECGELADAASHFHAALGHNPLSLTAAKGLQEVEALLGPAKAHSGSDSDSEGVLEDDDAPGYDTGADGQLYIYDAQP